MHRTLPALIRSAMPNLRRWARIGRGLRRHPAYDAASWWDDAFYTEGVSDRQTIGPRKSAVTAAYHYASVEVLIARHLLRTGITPRRVCDLGSGAGHWLDWYAALGAEVVGIDVSTRAVEHLSARHEAHHGPAHEVLSRLGMFDLLNAIGVMFHVVDDAEWMTTIRAVAAALEPGGLFIAGGAFGRLGSDVGLSGGRTYKRLRSEKRWRSALREAGFGEVTIYRNRAAIGDSVPENNVLVARRL